MSCCTGIVTQAKLDSLIARGDLIPGKSYEIAGTGIILTAINDSEFDIFGTRKMLVPTTYKLETLNSNIWKGVWHLSKSVDAGDLMIWGGFVWKNVTGNIGTASDDITLDGTNWTKIYKEAFTNYEYTEKVFKIIYDYANSWIVKQWDDNGNEFGISYELYQEFSFPANPVDMSDWNYTQDDSTNNILANNILIGSWNNVEGIRIYGNVFDGVISNNKLTTNSTISYNFISNPSEGSYAKISDNECGSIYGNHCASIENNTNTGDMYLNHVAGNISNNEAPLTEIRQNSGADQIVGNSNNGRIGWNMLAGGSIFNNSNNGQISTNQCSNIMNNSNGGYINWNIGSGDINNNSNDGDIYANTGTRNPVGGAFISGNTNDGDIYENHISGWISGNSGIGDIYRNHNNGNITSNALAGFSIYHNANNGDIDGNTLVADISDPVVNK